VQKLISLTTRVTSVRFTTHGIDGKDDFLSIDSPGRTRLCLNNGANTWKSC
jgi:hypothetical protein